MKFLIITPPAILFKITKRSIEDYKALGPFQNLDVGLLLNEAYGHTFTASTNSKCFRTHHGKNHEPKNCAKYGPDKGHKLGPPCVLYRCWHQQVTQ